MSLRIGVDVDGVLCDFINGFCDLAHDFYGKDLPRTPDCWNWADQHLTKEEHQDLWKHIETDPRWWGDLDPLNRVMHGPLIRRWARSHDLFAITTRPGAGSQWRTGVWLEDHFATPISVIVTRNARDKAKVARALDLTHFVDDNPDNIRAVMIEIPECKTRLISASHNLTATDLDPYRITELGDLL